MHLYAYDLGKENQILKNVCICIRLGEGKSIKNTARESVCAEGEFLNLGTPPTHYEFKRLAEANEKAIAPKQAEDGGEPYYPNFENSIYYYCPIVL